MLEKTLSTTGRIAHTLTPDKLELEGFYVEPTNIAEDIVFLQIHGMFENFHLPLFINIMADKIATNGYYFLTVNTRAKDYFIYFRQYKEDGSFEWKQEGGSYEIFSKCLLDIRGWLDYCEGLDKRVILMGHSHGALKVAYYALNYPNDPRVIGLVLLSPSDDVGGQINDIGDKYNDFLNIAQIMIDEKNGNEMIPHWCYGQPVTANMYMDMFGPDSDLAMFRYNEPSKGFSSFNIIKWPVLTIFGSDDKATAGVPAKNALELIDHALLSVKSHTTKIIEGANHHYIGKEEPLVNVILDWATDALDTKSLK